jgi:neutral ceramidase
MGSDLLDQNVMKRLDELILLKNPFNIRNISISRTRTHSAPGGFNQYALYQIPPLGFVHQTMDAFVEGIVTWIPEAYKNLQSGVIGAAREKL